MKNKKKNGETQTHGQRMIMRGGTPSAAHMWMELQNEDNLSTIVILQTK